MKTRFTRSVTYSRWSSIRLLIGIAVIGLNLPSHLMAIQADRPASQQKADRVRRTLELNLTPVQRGSTIISVNQEIDAVDAGGRYTYELVLTNQMPHPFQVDVIKANCDCVSIKLSQTTLATGESVSGKMFVDVPSGSPTSTFEVQFQFFDDPYDKPTASINLSAKVTGALGFGRGSKLFYVTEDISSHPIPLGITDPVSPSRLEIVPEGNLKEVAFELKSDRDGQFYVDAVVTRLAVGNAGLAGRLTVRDKKLGLESECYVSFIRPLPITISPLKLNFRRVDDRLVASAFVELDNVLANKNNEKPEIVGSARLKFETKSVTAKIVRLGKSKVSKLSVSLTLPQAAEIEEGSDEGSGAVEANYQAVWIIRTNKAVYETPISYGFPLAQK